MFKLIIGPMFSGKTSELISEYTKFTKTKKKVICFKPVVDTRYCDHDHRKSKLNGKSVLTSSINSHDNKHIAAYIIDELEEDMMSWIIETYDVFIFDEIQFIENSKAIITSILKKRKIAIATSLNGDFQLNPFPVTSSLIPLISKISLKKSLCYNCYSKASYTIRKNKKLKNKIVIGSDNIYSPSCFDCREKELTR